MRKEKTERIGGARGVGRIGQKESDTYKDNGHQGKYQNCICLAGRVVGLFASEFCFFNTGLFLA